MATLSSEAITHFQDVVSELDSLFPHLKLDDDQVEPEVRKWLDGDDLPLPWTYADRISPDEWFFISTLYGTMTVKGQCTHIRQYFRSLFANAAKYDIRNFVDGMPEFAGLRSPWMSQRLCRMAKILQERSQSMTEYTVHLRELESSSTPANPMPALDKIIHDHAASGGKTLSVFVRDCVRGNSFPIDSRVEKVLIRHHLRANERYLVRLALSIKRNPRHVARMFYEAGAGK